MYEENNKRAKFRIRIPRCYFENF